MMVQATTVCIVTPITIPYPIMMSQWTSLATPLPIVMWQWVKSCVNYVIPTKSSAQNGNSTGDLGMDIHSAA